MSTCEHKGSSSRDLPFPLLKDERDISCTSISSPNAISCRMGWFPATGDTHTRGVTSEGGNAHVTARRGGTTEMSAGRGEGSIWVCLPFVRTYTFWDEKTRCDEGATGNSTCLG